MTPQDAIVTAKELVEWVTERRPKWNRTHVIEKIAEASLTRDGLQLADDVRHAALDPEVKTPGAIPLHRAPAFTITECAVCEQRDQAHTKLHPPIDRCPRCGGDQADYDHRCRANGPPAWLPEVTRLNTVYATDIANAKTAGDYQLAEQLKAEQCQRITELTEEAS